MRVSLKTSCRVILCDIVLCRHMITETGSLLLFGDNICEKHILLSSTQHHFLFQTSRFLRFEILDIGWWWKGGFNKDCWVKDLKSTPSHPDWVREDDFQYSMKNWTKPQKFICQVHKTYAFVVLGSNTDSFLVLKWNSDSVKKKQSFLPPSTMVINITNKKEMTILVFGTTGVQKDVTV